MVMAVLLTACGGGGSSSPTEPPPTPPTPIPDSLAVSAPATADAASAVQFGNTASALTGLKFSWDFGDGSSSTDAAPSHKYAQGGDFTVVLKVTNEAGTSKEVRTPVSVTNLATVRGRVCSGANDSGWCWQSPRPVGINAADGYFVSAQVGWLVGENGQMLRTEDGGTSWKLQDPGVGWSLMQMRFLDASNGVVFGSGGLLRTADGGKTWTALPGSWSSAMPKWVTLVDGRRWVVQDTYDVMNVSTDAGATWTRSRPREAVVAANGTVWSLQPTGDAVLRSTDLGVSYKTVFTPVPPSGSRLDGMKLTALDDQRALASVTFRDEQTAKPLYQVWRTRDGGATWEQPAMKGVAAPANVEPYVGVRAAGFILSFFDYDTGNTELYRSVDAGDNWTRLAGPPNTSGSAENYEALDGGTLLFLSDAGIAVSSNGGVSWGAVVKPDSPTVGGLRSAQLLGGQTWQVVSGTGSVFRSDDKGQTWRTIAAPQASRRYYAFHPFDARHALAIDGDCKPMETQDGGATWQARPAPWTSCAGTGRIGEMSWRSAKVGWYNGPDGKLFRSVDGGLTWQDTASGVWVASVQFLDDNNGFALSDGRLLSTKTGGQSWTTVGMLPPEPLKIRFFSARQGMAISFFGLHVTHDGGLSWTQVNPPGYSDFSDVQHVDASTVWAVHKYGGLFKSTDGGDSWRQAATFQSNAIQFLDANRGWAVGWGGRIYATTDGGSNWVPQVTNTLRNLEQVYFVDSKTGWVVGEYGALLATGSGGR